MVKIKSFRKQKLLQERYRVEIEDISHREGSFWIELLYSNNDMRRTYEKLSVKELNVTGYNTYSVTNENQELDFSLGNELAGREHMGLVALAVNDETLDQFSDEARGLLIRLLNRVIR